MSVLAQMSSGQFMLALLLVAVCGFLILVILLQKGRGGGLAGAFGGGGGSSAFGAKTGDVFTWITVVVAVVFLVLAVVANFAFDQSAPKAVASTITTTTVPASTLPVSVQDVQIPIVPGGDTGASFPQPGDQQVDDAAAPAEDAAGSTEGVEPSSDDPGSTPTPDGAKDTEQGMPPAP